MCTFHSQHIKQYSYNFQLFNSYSHWVLAIIDVGYKEMYYLDSAGAREAPKTLVVIMLSAFRQFARDIGERPMQMAWKTIKCPRQSGDYECGYYVMQFMKHYMEDHTKSLRTKM